MRGRSSSNHLHQTITHRTYEGPPLTLTSALDEALGNNPTLVALRRQFDAVRQRPAQERFLLRRPALRRRFGRPVGTNQSAEHEHVHVHDFNRSCQAVGSVRCARWSPNEMRSFRRLTLPSAAERFQGRHARVRRPRCRTPRD